MPRTRKKAPGGSADWISIYLHTSISHSKHLKHIYPSSVLCCSGPSHAIPHAGSLAKRQGKRAHLRRRHAPRPNPGEVAASGFPFLTVVSADNVVCLFLCSGQSGVLVRLSCESSAEYRNLSHCARALFCCQRVWNHGTWGARLQHVLPFPSHHVCIINTDPSLFLPGAISATSSGKTCVALIATQYYNTR